MHVSWDSRREPGNRVLGVWLSKEVEETLLDGRSGHSTPRLVDAYPIERTRGGRKYKVVTREYMAQGHDGFLPLKGNRYLVDDEVGQLMSSLVRKYLLGMYTLPAHELPTNIREQDLNSSTRWSALLTTLSETTCTARRKMPYCGRKRVEGITRRMFTRRRFRSGSTPCS